ncbi:hypothetical protein [Slackia heliotrinireducens]|jgi:hypothetical protein|uniref:hypothetical protein n=1 Tax=Slackia heliotrinireducens TaxID=84110 RepID=UPI003314E9B7
MALLERSEAYGQLQIVVDHLFKNAEEVRRIDVIIAAESFDIHPDLLAVVERLPPGVYTRIMLVTQLNSTIAGHGWGYVYGTVE